MKTIIFLNKEWFTSEDKVILSNEYFNIKIFKYPSGIEGLTLENKKGYITLLPYMGQIIWDAKFNGIDLTMKNMFNQPKSKMYSRYLWLFCFSFRIIIKWLSFSRRYTSYAWRIFLCRYG